MNTETIVQKIAQERGSVAEIHNAFADYPAGMAAHYDFYKKLILEDGPLPRTEREWLAMETSIANECPYCYRHHTSAFENNGGEQKVITRRMELLSTLAASLSKAYWKAKLLKAEFTEEGFSEAEWQHAIMIVSYFNFANRVAHAMDLELESDFHKSCQ